MDIIFFSAKPYDKDYFSTVKSSPHKFTFIETHLGIDTIALAEGYQAVCCFVNDLLPKKVLRDLKSYGINLVLLRCAGFNNVDITAAKELEITVLRVPEYSPFAVAEHAVGLILDLNRNIHRAYNRVRENNYSLEGLMGFDLHGKTVGVIGAGKIGQKFTNILLGFGCHVLVYDVIEDKEINPLARRAPLAEIWEKSDIISLHCPLTPETHYLIDEDSIQKMKPGVMLINTSRGALIDTQAVIKGLKTKKMGYLGLDVYEEEGDLFFENLSNKIIQDDVFARLLTFPNVIVTGHQAFFTHEALQKIVQTTIQNIADYDAATVDSENCLTI